MLGRNDSGFGVVERSDNILDFLPGPFIGEHVDFYGPPHAPSWDAGLPVKPFHIVNIKKGDS
ncbi:hypothetical protein D3C85_1576720 [compost metagenome]